MKTAILMRGHPRTWHYTIRNNKSVMDNVYPDADWFIAMPSCAQKLDIVSYFEKQPVLIFLDEQRFPFNLDTNLTRAWRYYIPAYWKLAWFDYHIGICKRQKELADDMRYDNVVFLRPDVWYQIVDDTAKTKATTCLSRMEIAEISISPGMPDDDWVLGDLCWRAGSTAADIMLLRYLDCWQTPGMNQLVHGNSHTLIAYMQQRNLLSGSYYSAFDAMLARPDNFINLNADGSPTLGGYVWESMSTPDKIDACVTLGIDPNEYQLAY
jgi:hypothetical protein